MFGHFERAGILCWTFWLDFFFGFGHFLTARERERNEREMRERRGDEESIWTFFRSGLFKREEEYVGHFLEARKKKGLINGFF